MIHLFYSVELPRFPQFSRYLINPVLLVYQNAVFFQNLFPFIQQVVDNQESAHG